MFQGFGFIVLLAAMLPLSCATPLQPVNSLTQLNETNSIIFGEIECWKNDKLMVKPATKYPYPNSDIPNIGYHISRYVSDATLNTNLWKPGEYCFKVPVFNNENSENGCFSAVIPPGKYYFVEIDYLNFFEKPVIGMRTYTGKQPVLMTFDAPANQAVYIGTLRNRLNTLHDNLFYFEVAMQVDVTDEFEDAKAWFLKSNQRFETNIVDGTAEIRPLSN